MRARALWAIAGSVGAIAALPAAASAADRYASPTGTAAPATGCQRAAPCSLIDAVGGAGVTDGDVVHLLSGTYALSTSSVGVFNRITIEGEPGSARPLVQNNTLSGSTFVTAGASAAGTVFRDLVLKATDGNDVLHMNSMGTATVERVKAIAAGNTQTGVQLLGTMRDSVVDFHGSAGGAAIRVCCNATSSLRNITAIASSPGSDAVSVTGPFGPNATANLRNVIARGDGAGIRLIDSGGTGDNVLRVDVAHSNFSSIQDDPSPDTTVVQGAGNQTVAPLFVDSAGGDYRQKPGSPTIDKGTTDPLLGSLDFDLQPRIQGPAPDIGADEAIDPASLLTLGLPAKLHRRKVLTVTARCNLVDCNLAEAATLRLKGRKRHKRHKRQAASAAKAVALPAATAALSAGRDQTISFTLSKKVLKRLRRAKRATLVLNATATDSLGFTGTASGTVGFAKK